MSRAATHPRRRVVGRRTQHGGGSVAITAQGFSNREREGGEESCLRWGRRGSPREHPWLEIPMPTPDAVAGSGDGRRELEEGGGVWGLTLSLLTCVDGR